ncbi:glycosyltransferase [Agrococcus sp. Marseille-Q4369]|uniref:glycosyltransferase n=1 Tax=Agrococcus sp. Marseille-Q4369 TaxID=2810513 RepID=UPI001B8BBDCB|nr:glycosyltransferase [Agrococcus sp. Marseille-Q4369]QUW18561.1 glycosyltransferase [Agrococcus sp. Marseille-Q4369]
MTELVVVLMATHNGASFLEEQVASILAQRGVEVRVVISDDGSTDGTRDLLRTIAAEEPRVVLLEPVELGSAHANFLRLIADAPWDGASVVAFSDQDDVWHVERLAAQVDQLRGVDAVSANVVADYGDRRILIDKAQPQRSLDFVLESAGPGCTFVLSARAFELVRRTVVEDPETAAAPIHDWLVYAIVRAAGMRWHIDPTPVIDYRQHADNVAGANLGWRQARRRLRRLRSGGFRREAAVVTRIAARVAAEPERTRLHAVAALLERDDLAARLVLARGVGSLRRRPADRVALAALLLLGLW